MVSKHLGSTLLKSQTYGYLLFTDLGNCTLKDLPGKYIILLLVSLIKHTYVALAEIGQVIIFIQGNGKKNFFGFGGRMIPDNSQIVQYGSVFQFILPA